MRKLIKSFFEWIFDIEGSRSEDVLEESISGEPLVKIHTRRIRVYKTEKGRKGSLICAEITQFGRDTELMKKVIRGQHDDVLSHSNKAMLLGRIRKRAEAGGQYVRTVYNNKGTLDFVYDYWHYGDLKEIRELLKKHCDEPEIDPVPDLPR